MQRDDTWVLESAGGAPIMRKPPAAFIDLAAEGGISINGDAPWDIQVLDERTYQRVLSKGSLGFGEAYMDGMWECEHLDQFFHRLLSSKADEKIDNW